MQNEAEGCREGSFLVPTSPRPCFLPCHWLRKGPVAPAPACSQLSLQMDDPGSCGA